MPSPKKQCPTCGNPMHPKASQCRTCKPSYERTPVHRALMTEVLTGRTHDYPSASNRPEVAAKIQEWWTPERREAKRQQSLAVNPDARYHGLSASGARRIREAAGACASCGSTRRLDVHHKDRNKRNQDPANLIVLCHPCHMQAHVAIQESLPEPDDRRYRMNRNRQD